MLNERRGTEPRAGRPAHLLSHDISLFCLDKAQCDLGLPHRRGLVGFWHWQRLLRRRFVYGRLWGCA